MAMNNTGILVISLDFELIWGVFDHVDLQHKAQYFENTLQYIPRLLEVFAENQIHVTWATVGMLFNENWEEWEANIPTSKPTYTNSILDPYRYGQQMKKTGLDRFFFASHLVDKIHNTPHQEMATHTYSHYYCLEQGQIEEQFEADIVKAVAVASKRNIQLKSLVFPRNQFNEGLLDTCVKYGIEVVRSNPSDWYWDTKKESTLAVKLFRTGDAYLPLGDKSYALGSISPQQPLCQPASRFFRPQHKIQLLNRMRLERIKNEIIHAAQKGHVYHLWWHPHNMGIDPKGFMNGLKEILDVYRECAEKYGMRSLTMDELRTSSFVTEL